MQLGSAISYLLNKIETVLGDKGFNVKKYSDFASSIELKTKTISIAENEIEINVDTISGKVGQYDVDLIMYLRDSRENVWNNIDSIWSSLVGIRDSTIISIRIIGLRVLESPKSFSENTGVIELELRIKAKLYVM